MTRLCVPILVRGAAQARSDALKAVEHGADMIELRLDALPGEVLDDADAGELAAVAKLVNDLKAQAIPCVLTLRPAKEGGRSHADDGRRFETLANVVHRAPAWVDLEWRPMARGGGWPMAFLDLAAGQPGGDVRFVVSAHDFTGRPKDLIGLFADMSQSRADVVKLAWRARTVRDNVEAFELLREAVKPSVAVCMGEAGLPSRVLARKFNAYLSFAASPEAGPTAEGQVPVDVMKRRYRWDKIGRDTRVFGVVAHPVAHSRSPHVHNAAFDAVGFDGVYLPLPVEPGYESFKAFMETWLAFEPLDLTGLSVTLPHKENALRYAREKGGRIDPVADRVGSANTLLIARHPDDGAVSLRAANTDYDAMLGVARGALGVRRADLAGLSVGVLGAGGTGRTAVAAFAGAGCDVTVYNRTRQRADELAAEFDARSAGMGEVRRGEHRIWVNTTSLGMAKTAEASATPFGDAPPPLDVGTLVFDTIYAPAETPLLAQAAAAGARTVNGEPMFLQQAAAQFELWARQPAPMEAMRDAFREEA